MEVGQVLEMIAEKSGVAEMSYREAFRLGPGPILVLVGYQAYKGAEIAGEAISKGAGITGAAIANGISEAVDAVGSAFEGAPEPKQLMIDDDPPTTTRPKVFAPSEPPRYN